jgi:hypothetical protein
MYEVGVGKSSAVQEDSASGEKRRAESTFVRYGRPHNEPYSLSGFCSQPTRPAS